MYGPYQAFEIICTNIMLCVSCIVFVFVFGTNNIKEGVVELKDLSPIFYVLSLDCILAQ